MSRERLHLYDTTLRDGAQTAGVDFSIEDKRAVIGWLDALGVDTIEAGYPGANPLDTALFSARPVTKRARVAAFGMTKRPGMSAGNDPGLAMLLAAKADAVTFVAKAWDHQVRVALGCSVEENLEGIGASLGAAVAAGFEANLDAEHFFDGFKANPDHALSVLAAAVAAGARWVVLCDTNGGTLPGEVVAITREAARAVPAGRLGIHAHDDTGHAVANTLAAIDAGARHVQGTLNGLGERCGNADLVTLIPTLMLKPALAERYALGVSEEALAGLTALSRRFDERLNRAPRAQAPYVGAAAFATKAGIHASALAKEPAAYEHADPARVGNARRLLMSDQGGRSNLLATLARLGIAAAPDDARLPGLLAAIKEREAAGYAYEAAEASLGLLARRHLSAVPDYFRVERFKVSVERRFNARGELVSASEATVKVTVGGETLISAAEGDGPVNALDRALRKDLGRYQRHIEGLRLADYRVRVYEGGTEAVTRVLVESTDEAGARWTTVGASRNIIDASFQALVDAITHKLIADGAVV